jgi:hypothetical protein
LEGGVFIERFMLLSSRRQNNVVGNGVLLFRLGSLDVQIEYLKSMK